MMNQESVRRNTQANAPAADERLSPADYQEDLDTIEQAINSEQTRDALKELTIAYNKHVYGVLRKRGLIKNDGYNRIRLARALRNDPKLLYRIKAKFVADKNADPSWSARLGGLRLNAGRVDSGNFGIELDRSYVQGSGEPAARVHADFDKLTPEEKKFLEDRIEEYNTKVTRSGFSNRFDPNNPDKPMVYRNGREATSADLDELDSIKREFAEDLNAKLDSGEYPANIRVRFYAGKSGTAQFGWAQFPKQIHILKTQQVDDFNLKSLSDLRPVRAGTVKEEKVIRQAPTPIPVVPLREGAIVEEDDSIIKEEKSIEEDDSIGQKETTTFEKVGEEVAIDLKAEAESQSESISTKRRTPDKLIRTGTKPDTKAEAIPPAETVEEEQDREYEREGSKLGKMGVEHTIRLGKKVERKLRADARNILKNRVHETTSRAEIRETFGAGPAEDKDERAKKSEEVSGWGSSYFRAKTDSGDTVIYGCDAVVDGKYVPEHYYEKKSGGEIISESDFKNKINLERPTNAEIDKYDLIKKLGLIKVEGDPDYYVRPQRTKAGEILRDENGKMILGWEGKYYPRKDMEGNLIAIDYSGGKMVGGRDCIPQTFTFNAESERFCWAPTLNPRPNGSYREGDYFRIEQFAKRQGTPSSTL